MDFLGIKTLILSKSGSDSLEGEELAGKQYALIISPQHLFSICRELHDNPTTWFDFLSCISGVDHGPGQGFEVVYHLASIPHNLQLTLKVKLPDLRNENELPSVPSVSTIWKTAEWHEREAFDLVGIYFKNHPDLRRILLPDDWQGHPLRKDYKDAEHYHGIPIN